MNFFGIVRAGLHDIDLVLTNPLVGKFLPYLPAPFSTYIPLADSAVKLLEQVPGLQWTVASPPTSIAAQAQSQPIVFKSLVDAMSAASKFESDAGMIPGSIFKTIIFLEGMLLDGPTKFNSVMSILTAVVKAEQPNVNMEALGPLVNGLVAAANGVGTLVSGQPA